MNSSSPSLSITKQDAYRCRKRMVTAKSYEIKWRREREPMVMQEFVGSQRREMRYAYVY